MAMLVVIQFILQANIMSIGFESLCLLQTDLNPKYCQIIATYVYKKGPLDGDYSFSTAVIVQHRCQRHPVDRSEQRSLPNERCKGLV